MKITEDKRIIKRYVKHPELRRIYIMGMLTGVKLGSRTVEDVYDRIEELLDNTTDEQEKP